MKGNLMCCQDIRDCPRIPMAHWLPRLQFTANIISNLLATLSFLCLHNLSHICNMFIDDVCFKTYSKLEMS